MTNLFLNIKLTCICVVVATTCGLSALHADEGIITSYTRLGIPFLKITSSGSLILTTEERMIIARKAQEECNRIGASVVVKETPIPSTQKDVPEELYLDFLRENHLQSYPRSRFWVLKVECMDLSDQDPNLMLSNEVKHAPENVRSIDL